MRSAGSTKIFVSGLSRSCFADAINDSFGKQDSEDVVGFGVLEVTNLSMIWTVTLQEFDVANFSA
jgi:hypothetical protein